MLEEYRIDGRYITARDVSQRLMPDLDINEVLLWSPDLFAYTSYILTMTSAYQLVVSPPSGKCWEPKKSDIVSWLCKDVENNLYNWLDEVKKIWGCEEGFEPDVQVQINEIKEFEKTNFNWQEMVHKIGIDWKDSFNKVSDPKIFDVIDDNEFTDEDRKAIEIKINDYKNQILKRNPDETTIKNFLKAEEVSIIKEKKKLREKQLLKILLTNTPSLLLGCWAFFYNEIIKSDFYQEKELNISDLLCNQDHIHLSDDKKDYCNKLWNISQALLTMHAIADNASLEFGIKYSPDTPSLKFAEKLLFGRDKGNLRTINLGGSLSTFNTERARVLPKRHNPSVGITLRSISSNLAFHQSATDVVWRKAENNLLANRLIRAIDENPKDKKTHQKFSILLLPFPLDIKSKDFHDESSDKTLKMDKGYGFFSYEPHTELKPSEKKDVEKEEVNKATNLIFEANKELPKDYYVDMVVFPEASLSLDQFRKLQEKLKEDFDKIAPSVIIAGIRESKSELSEEMTKRTKKMIDANELNFVRNAVYCKYYDYQEGKYYKGSNPKSEKTPKYKQYKHHRWQLEESQIKRYGLSSVLDTEKVWWENIKVPKRRVSFLNIGDRLTVSHLICEDLARQDPIAELIRHVGPSLVVTILMDGPQLRNRWSSRYATVLSNDPGSSVITLTSLGMVKRYISEFGLMSRVVAVWSESGSSHPRELELAQGAEAILLTLEIEKKAEKTADGRTETTPTSVVRLVDVIQVYPKNYSQR